MTEQTYKPLPMRGDATSILVQAIVRNVGLKDFSPTGKGDEDIAALVRRSYNDGIMAKALWLLVEELGVMIDAKEDLPEAFKAVWSARILALNSSMQLARK